MEEKKISKLETSPNQPSSSSESLIQFTSSEYYDPIFFHLLRSTLYFLTLTL